MFDFLVLVIIPLSLVILLSVVYMMCASKARKNKATEFNKLMQPVADKEFQKDIIKLIEGSLKH